MREIPLTKGAVALIDDADFERVSAYKWTLDQNGYAVRKQTIERRQYRKVMLHRFIWVWVLSLIL